MLNETVGSLNQERTTIQFFFTSDYYKAIHPVHTQIGPYKHRFSFSLQYTSHFVTTTTTPSSSFYYAAKTLTTYSLEEK